MPTQRIRSRGSASNVVTTNRTWTTSCPGAGTSTYTGYVSARLDSVIETMTDEVRGARSSTRNTVGDVTHQKIEGNHYPLGKFSYTPGSTCPNGTVLRYIVDHPQGYYVQPYFPSIDNPPGWSSTGVWCDSQLRHLVEAVPRAASLPNFLLEIPEIPKLVTQLSSFATAFGRGATLGSVAKSIAGGHLAYQFGVLSPIRDVRALLGAHRSALKRLAWLRKNNQKRYTVRRRRSDTTIVPAQYDYSAGVQDFTSTIVRDTSAIHAKVTEVVGAQAFQSFSGLDESLSEVKAIASAYGFNKPLSVIWEAIPLSWVVDYFLHLGDIIDSTSQVSTYSGTIHLSDPWYSRKVTYRTRSSCRGKGWLYGFKWEDGDGVVSDFTFTNYSRSSTIPSWYSSPMLSGSITGSQITNLAALLTQRGL